MSSLPRRALRAVPALLILLNLWLWSLLYGDPRLSIGNVETHTYITSARRARSVPDLFTERRPFTMSLLYRLAADERRCTLVAISMPAIGEEQPRRLQPCFAAIVVMQRLVAAVGWTMLAWVMFRHLKHRLLAFASAAVILLFSLTREVAEWDSVLDPASLTFSLFAAVIALATMLVVRDFRDGEGPLAPSRDLAALFALALFFLWVSVRDIHIAAPAVALIAIIPALLRKPFRRATMVSLPLILLGTQVAAVVSAGAEARSRGPLRNAFETYVLPNAGAVDFMQRLGMPPSDSAAYPAWFKHRASAAYAVFLLTHPRFVVATLLANSEHLVSDSHQPYFPPTPRSEHWAVRLLGKVLHPRSLGVYVLALGLPTILLLGSTRWKATPLLGWGWLTAWIALTGLALLVIGFFGDVPGTRRHIIPAIEIFRLSTWILLFVLADVAAALLNRPRPQGLAAQQSST